MMKIIVNGSAETIPSGSIRDFIRSKGLADAAVVVEHNFRIARKEEWARIQLEENDNLEVLSFVGGG